MELIPILSLIILVATISTFILAVGAYILYKIRERKGQAAQTAQPASIPGELVAPAPLLSEQRLTQTADRRTFTGEQFPTRGESYVRETFVERAPSAAERKTSGPELRPTYISSPPPRATVSQPERARVTRVTSTSGFEPEKSAKRKFMRYTSEGFAEPVKKEEKKEDKLRWR